MDDPYVSGVCHWWHRRGGRLLLRMCLTTAGVSNGLDEKAIDRTFRGWRHASTRRVELVSDTRTMPAVLAILIRPDTG